MNKAVVESLTAARELLAKPDGWCKGDMHKRVWKDETENEIIDQYCSLGALQKVDGVGERGAIQQLAVIVGQRYHYGTVALFNDNPATRLVDVLSAFDQAIEAASK